MSIGGGKSKSSSSSKPVTWKKLMMPAQISGINAMFPHLLSAGLRGFQGRGLSPEEETTYKEDLTGSLSEYAGGQKAGLQERAEALGQEGGAVEGAMNAIDASKIMGFGQGLRGIWDLGQRQKMANIQNLLSFLTWHPPVAQESKSKGRGWQARGEDLGSIAGLFG